MRATSTRRLVGGAASLMLIGTMLLTAAGSALAADTRKIYLGPDPAFIANPGTLAFTPVSAGGDSLSALYLKNIDNQTLTHVVITIQRVQGANTISDQLLGADTRQCTVTAATIVCDYGNLKAGATRQFSIIVHAQTTALVSAQIVFNESNNLNGGNQQIDQAAANITVAGASCNSAATFVPPGVAKALTPSDGSTCSIDHQRSGLLVPANGNGNLIAIDDSTAATSCGALTCLGNQVSASVNNGAPVSPYLKWTIFYANDVLGNVSPGKVAFNHDGTIIPAGNKGLCKNATSTNCQDPYLVSPTGVTFFVRTPSNGLIKGGF